MKARISPGSIARLVSSVAIVGPALACTPGSVRAPKQVDPLGPSMPAPSERTLPRVIAYVHCLCGFGVGTSHDACLDEPDPNVNQVALSEERGTSPITHYLIAFLTFDARSIATDAGSVWANGGGSTTDFDLDEHLKVALQAAQRHRKQVWLSIGGESGSGGFLPWWQGLGASSAERTERMRAELERVSARFEAQNGVHVDGFDVDVELGGFYGRTSDKYVATRDLINAVPAPRRVAFTPQVSNGLCAAPAPGDALPAALTLGGGCDGPSGEDPRWVLASLDDDCKTAEGGPKLEYFGVQYYNEGTDPCCGGGPDPSAIVRSTLQHYVNLANGWPAPTESDHSSGRTWAAFAGIGADRLVIGKPGCAGCAESGYLDLPNMMKLIDGLDHRLRAPMGGVLFWELCRMFGRAGDLCEANGCQPSWGGKDILTNLAELRRRMSALRVLVPN